MTDDRWLSDYLLGEEDDGEAARRLASDPELREQARRLDEIVARLAAMPDAAWRCAVPERVADSAVPIAVPGDRSTRTEPRRVLGRDRGVSPGRRLGAGRRSVGSLAGVALALVLIAVGVGVGALIWSGGQRPPVPAVRGQAALVTLRPLAGSTSGATGAVRLAPGRQIVLSVRGLPVTDPAHYYEVWLMSNARRLVALGTFRVRPGGRATVTVSLPTAATRYRYFDVSLQSLAGGSAHSGDSVLRGPTARA